MIRRAGSIGMLGAFAALSACTGPMSALHPIPSTDAPIVDLCNSTGSSACASEATFTYLGVGGFLIRAGDDAVLSAPFFSHVRASKVVIPKLFRISSKPAVVDSQLHRLLGARADTALGRVRGVLVGHSHYDHLLDVPYIMRAYTPSAQLEGGLTTKRLLMGDPWMRAHSALVDSIPPDSAGTPWHRGSWRTLPGGRIRIMALRSSHAPNVFHITLAPGHVDTDATKLPRTAWGWEMGDPYAYLIDVLDASSRVVFRVLYQDAAAKPMDVLLPPFPPGDDRRVDVAIICAGNFANVKNYPTLLDGALHPRVVLVGHWEDFFRAADAPLAPIQFTKTKTLAGRLDQSAPRWYTLEPGARLRVIY